VPRRERNQKTLFLGCVALTASFSSLTSLVIPLAAWLLASAEVRAADAKPAVASPSPSELVVFGAASLRDVFARLAQAFERQNPGVKVLLNFGGSQELRTQLENGAAADVFASADHKNLDPLVAQGLASMSSDFACNELALVVRAGLKADVKTLGDLPRVDRLVVGGEQVPIGAYTGELLEKAKNVWGTDFPRRVLAKVVSRELNVKQVLTKVVLGEADAGFVYRTDALAGGGLGTKARVVPLPASVNVVARYPLAVLAKAPHPSLAGRWVDLLRSPTGLAALRDAGFVPCPVP